MVKIIILLLLLQPCPELLLVVVVVLERRRESRKSSQILFCCNNNCCLFLSSHNPRDSPEHCYVTCWSGRLSGRTMTTKTTPGGYRWKYTTTGGKKESSGRYNIFQFFLCKYYESHTHSFRIVLQSLLLHKHNTIHHHQTDLESTPGRGREHRRTRRSNVKERHEEQKDGLTT